MKASISSAAALFALLPILAGAHPHHGHHHHHHHHDADSSSSSSSIQQYRKSLNFGPSHVHAKYEVEPKEHRHHRHSKKTMTTKRSFATTTTPSHEHLDDRIDPAARDIAVQVLDDEVSKIVTTTTTTTASGQGTRTSSSIEGVAYYIRDDVSLFFPICVLFWSSPFDFSSFWVLCAAAMFWWHCLCSTLLFFFLPVFCLMARLSASKVLLPGSCATVSESPFWPVFEGNFVC